MTRVKHYAVATAAAFLIPLAVTPASAQGGLFDVLDPCIAAGESVSQYRSKMQAELQASIAKAESIGPSVEYKKLWWLEKRKALRPYFDANVVPKLPAGLTPKQLDATFKLWLNEVVAAQGGWAKIDRLIAADWDRTREQQIADARQTVNGALDQQDREFRAQCPADFGNQLLRGTLTIVMAPINIATRNLELAGREGTLLGKLVAAPTGISITSIANSSSVLGENSDARKILGPVAPVIDVATRPLVEVTKELAKIVPPLPKISLPKIF